MFAIAKILLSSTPMVKMMLKIFVIISVIIISTNAFAITAEEGQAAFDSVFWGIMTIWALGLSFGLAVKLINRS